MKSSIFCVVALYLAAMSTGCALAARSRAEAAPVGFAAVKALGQSGTTGGADGRTVEVSTASELLPLLGATEPLVIRVHGMLALPQPMQRVASDKTILGVGAHSGFSGGGLNIHTAHNIILRNLVFTGSPNDAINIESSSHHVWVDHCDLSRAEDGLLDIKRGSDYITVSWNHFHDHNKTALLGHDDNNEAEDSGHLRVTYHHNWFDGTTQRHPRARFGEPVHVFNNYYLNNSYGVAAQMNAGVVVEGNYFENVRKPTRNDIHGTPGRIVQRRNIFVHCGPPVSFGTVTEPSTYYSYTLEDAADVKASVMRGAGTGKLEF